MMQSEQPLQVARCTKIINPGTEDAKYMINVRQIAKYVVGLGERVSPTDIEEGMRVGYVFTLVFGFAPFCVLVPSCTIFTKTMCSLLLDCDKCRPNEVSNSD